MVESRLSWIVGAFSVASTLAVLAGARGGPVSGAAEHPDTTKALIARLADAAPEERFDAAYRLVTETGPAGISVLKGALQDESFRRSAHSVAAAEFTLERLEGAKGVERSAAGARRPNVLFISIDTLRADHLGCYGYSRPTSPTIDRLAQEGTLFLEAMSPTSWTLPAHASMFTGLYPSVHKVEDGGVKLDASIATLAELLKEDGYETAAFVSHSYLTRPFGLMRGFSHHDYKVVDARGQSDRARFWLLWHRFHAARGLMAPHFFQFVHYFDPHETYSPPLPYKEKFFPDYSGALRPSDHLVTMYSEKPFETPADLRYALALYDGEIAFVDSQLAPLFRALQQLGLDRDTVVVLTSDHGEEFKDHGSMGHKETLYEEVLRVPLIFRFPGKVQAGQRLSMPVSLVDLLPTLAELTKIQAPVGVQGVSLRSALRGRSEPQSSDRVVFAELGPLGRSWERSFRRRVARNATHKLIVNYSDEATVQELFLLSEDRKEQRNVYASLKDRPEVRRLEELLARRTERARTTNADLPARNPVNRSALGAQALERLRALGYALPGESVPRP